MIIDQFYFDSEKIVKNDYLIGSISQIYRSNCVVLVENLSLLNPRRIRNEKITPNSIGYFVVIDSIDGIYVGEVYQSKFNDSFYNHKLLENGEKYMIFPEISIELLAYASFTDDRFNPVSNKTPGLTDKVYFANSKVLNKYIKSLQIKSKENDKRTVENLDPFATVKNLLNSKLLINPQTLFDRHCMSIGTTNSGKSTTSLAIIDKLIKKNIKVLFFDPTGEYSETFKVDRHVKSIELGKDATIKPGKINLKQWCLCFETNDTSQPSILASAIKSLKYCKEKEINGVFRKVGQKPEDVECKLNDYDDDLKDFDIKLLPNQIIEESIEISKDGIYKYSTFAENINQWLIKKVKTRLENEKFVKFFSDVDNIDLLKIIDEFIENREQSLYIDASKVGIGDGIGSMIVDLLSFYIMNVKNNESSFVFFIDEVHRYTKDVLSETNENGLTLIAREGRKKGVFLFLTTQNPQDVSGELFSQIGTLFIHRITHKNELEAIKNYINENSYKIVPKLRQGETILTSINLLTDLILEIEKSDRKHNNQTSLLYD